jgi:hypothetical protein
MAVIDHDLERRRKLFETSPEGLLWRAAMNVITKRAGRKGVDVEWRDDARPGVYVNAQGRRKIICPPITSPGTWATAKHEAEHVRLGHLPDPEFKNRRAELAASRGALEEWELSGMPTRYRDQVAFRLGEDLHTYLVDAIRAGVKLAEIRAAVGDDLITNISALQQIELAQLIEAKRAAGGYVSAGINGRTPGIWDPWRTK